MKYFWILLVILSASACAKTPESIAPSYISDQTYQDWTCEQLVREQASLERAYTNVAAQQKKARSNDVVGILLIGLPVSSLSGDNVAPQVADIKGREEAVRLTITRKGC